MKIKLPATFTTALLCGVMADASAQPALKDIFRADFMIGAALNGSQISNAAGCEVELVQKHFNTITPENILKWEAVHPAPGRFKFAAADRFVEFGEKPGMFMVGHTLIWHSQTPRWVFEDGNGRPISRAALLERMRDHIHTVVGRYRGKIGGWDVVNEALADDGSLRNSPWRKILGDDYIARAFEFAREADPAAELYYNDYSMENAAKRDGGVALIRKLQAQGVKVSGVGLQGHYRLNAPTATQVDEAISAFAALGVKVMITELDVDVLPRTGWAGNAEVSLNVAARPELNPYTNGLPAEIQQQLAKRYGELFSVFGRHRGSISRVTFWGVTDGNSWLNNWPVRGRTSHPLLFDRNCLPKPALDAVIETQKSRLSGANGDG